jgi:D-alanyl-D-alanine carboxypeptidase
LNHTAGVPSFEDFLARQRTVDRLTAADVLASYLRQPRVSNPGERWEYQNGGHVVLSHVVAKASGSSTYVELMRKRIFEALGMRNTFFAEEPRLATARRAIGYYREWYGLKTSETLPPLRFYNGQASLFFIDRRSLPVGSGALSGSHIALRRTGRAS